MSARSARVCRQPMKNKKARRKPCFFLLKFAENENFSRNAIDMALGRGGDQVVIKDNEQYKFYGGKTKELEKRTRVKAITNFNNLFILVTSLYAFHIVSCY